jgi:hypothetical protein
VFTPRDDALSSFGLSDVTRKIADHSTRLGATEFSRHAIGVGLQILGACGPPPIAIAVAATIALPKILPKIASVRPVYPAGDAK